MAGPNWTKRLGTEQHGELQVRKGSQEAHSHSKRVVERRTVLLAQKAVHKGTENILAYRHKHEGSTVSTVNARRGKEGVPQDRMEGLALLQARGGK